MYKQGVMYIYIDFYPPVDSSGKYLLEMEQTILMKSARYGT